MKNCKQKRLIASILILLFLLLLLLLASCQKKEQVADEWQRFEQIFIGPFDTVTDLVAYTKDEDSFKELEELVLSDLKYYHALFDFYENYEGVNNIKSINDEAGQSKLKIDPVLMDFLKQCKWANEISEGRVNIAFGSVLSIWHSHRMEALAEPKEAKLPDLELLQAANEHTDINDLLLDEKAGTAYLQDPLMSLDAGSGAKGYACELIALHAQDEGYESFVISLGGNVRTVGKKPDGSKWHIGIKNPDSSADEKILDVLAVEDLALVTSGIYERYYSIGGVVYHHIVDPETLHPSRYFDSVTLIAPSSKIADALTTALMNMSYEEGLELISSLENCEALWVKDDKRFKSPGYTELLASD